MENIKNEVTINPNALTDENLLKLYNILKDNQVLIEDEVNDETIQQIEIEYSSLIENQQITPINPKK